MYREGTLSDLRLIVGGRHSLRKKYIIEMEGSFKGKSREGVGVLAEYDARGSKLPLTLRAH